MTSKPIVHHGGGGRRLKICLASWAPFLAGAEVAGERLAVGLQEAGHEVFVLLGTPGDTLKRMRAAGLRCVCLPLCLTDRKHWWRYLWTQRALRRLLRDEGPDVIHCNDLPTSQMVSQAAGRLKVPRVCHHRWIFDQVAIDWLNKFGAERHLFVSQYLMDELSRGSPRLAVCPRAVVYDGLPLPAVPSVEDRQNARRELGLPPDKTLVLFAGQIIERKGVAELLRAWSTLSSQGRDKAELLVVGDDLEQGGAYRRQMEQLAANLGCPARFVGFQRNVPRWLTAADMAIVPSHAEPLGNATLEAMAHRLPVIGCRVGGIPEMIVPEETGLLVPPREPGPLAAAIQRLLSDESLRLRLGARARERCEHCFSLKGHVEAVLEQYELAMRPVSAAGSSAHFTV